MRRRSHDTRRRQRPIHERVARHVEHSGLTEGQIAEETGWSAKKVHRLLIGKTCIRAEYMEVFARILRKPIEDLFSEPSERAS